MKLNSFSVLKTAGIWGLFALISLEGNGQTPQQIMNAVYKKYDSTSYLSFNVKFNYSTDTLYGEFKQETQKGSYTLAGHKAKFNIGDIDFLQNDSFFIAVYNSEQLIFLTDPRTYNAGSELPLRGLIDSMFQTYNVSYNITSAISGGTGSITFIRTDTLAQFDKFSIEYDSASHFLTALKYEFTQIELTNPFDTTGSPPKYLPRKKRLVVEFSNYRLDNLVPESYSESNYVWFENGEWKPVSKYRDFRVYNSKSVYKPE